MALDSQISYDELNRLLDAASQSINTGGTRLTPEQIAALYAPPKPKVSSLKETAKAVGRGVLGIPKLATNVAQGGALDVGALFGITPEQNTVSQNIQQGTQAIEGLQQGETLAPNVEYAQEHPVMNAVNRGFIEGGLPWLGAGALSRVPVVGKYALPAAAVLSAQAEGTNRLMHQGMEGNEALATSTPGALAEGGAFALMHPAMNYLKGSVNPATGEVIKGALPGFLGQPGGVLKGALQGTVADAPFLAAQGELKQGVDVAAGAMTPEEYQAQHTPEALANMAGSSLVGGIGFGGLGAIGQKGLIDRGKAVLTDKTTPVDVLQPPMTHPLTSIIPDERWTQPELPIPGVKTNAPKPTLDAILPQGEGVFEYGQGMKLANQIKKNFGLSPEVTPLGLDVTGTRRVRIALRPEEQPFAPQEQGVFDFNATEQGLPPRVEVPLETQLGFDLTGKANPEPAPVPKVPEQSKDIQGISIVPSTIPEAPLPVQPPVAVKKETKGKVASKEVKPVVEEPASSAPRDLQADLADYITNKESKVDPAPIAEALGRPVEDIVAARTKNLSGELGEKTAPPVEAPTEKKQVGPEVLATTNEKGQRVIKAKKMRDAQEKIELPSGVDVPIEQVTERAKKYANATMGYEDTAFSKDLFKALAIRKKLTHQDIVNIWNANKDSYGISDAEKIGKSKDIARRQKTYQDKSIETLYKALQEGKIDAHVKGDVDTHAFTIFEGTTAKELGEWYQENIQGKSKNKSKGVISEGEAPKEIGEVSITKADRARMAKAERARQEVFANAQRPHTIYKERMDAFKDEMARINGEIAKLPKGTEKSALRKAYDRVISKLNEHLAEGVHARLEAEAKPLYEQMQKMVAQVRKETASASEEKQASAIKLMKKQNPKAIEIQEKIEALKQEAKETGRLDVEDFVGPRSAKDPLKTTIAIFREKIEHARKAKPVEEYVRQDKVEEELATTRKEQDFIKDMSNKDITDEEIIDHADTILNHFDKETYTEFTKIKVDKAFEIRRLARAEREKGAALTTEEKRNLREDLQIRAQANFLRELVAKVYKKMTSGIKSFGERGRETEPTKPTPEVKTAKEIEAETDPEVKKLLEEQKAQLEALKEKKLARADEVAKLTERETASELKARKEAEAQEAEKLAEEERVKAEKHDREREQLSEDIRYAPEDRGPVFKFKEDKNGNTVSKAGEEFKKFEASTKQVGSSGSIPQGISKFVSHVAEKFKLSSRIFVTTESDIKTSNIKDVSDIAREIFDEQGNYVGVLHQKGDMSFLALNDARMHDNKLLVNTVSHELGHAIMEEHFDSADVETQTNILKEYSRWVDSLEQGDIRALDELYQDSGKTWEDFTREYREFINDQTKQGFDVKDEIFNEYIAEQVAKYIKVTESKPSGVLAKFFTTLANKLRYLIQYVNKDFAKNRMPIQSVEKWMNDLVASKRVDTKTKLTNGALKKTQVEKAENEFARGFKQIFDPAHNDTLAERMTNMLDINLRDKGIIKQAVNGILRTPYWRANVREATNNFAKSLEATSSMKHFFRGEFGSEKLGKEAHSFKEIAKAYGDLPKSERELMNRLLIEGDKLGKEWTNKKDSQSETFQNISDEAFKIYRNSREFIDQAWSRICNQFAETQAHTLTNNADLRVAIKEAIMDKNIQTKEQLETFLKEHRDVRRTGLDTMLSEGEKNTLLDTLTEEDGIKSQYKDFSRNYGKEGLVGYIPRERLEGAEWTVSLKKRNSAGDTTPVFNQAFYTKAEADRVARDLQLNPEKYLPHNFLSMKPGESLDLDNIKADRVQERDRFGYKDDEVIANKVASALEGMDINPTNKQEIINNVRKEITKQLLAQHGKQHIINRKKTLIEGYSEDSPLDAFESVLNRTAYSFAKMQYVSDQADLLSGAERDKKPEIKEYINQTLKPVGMGGAQAQKLKNAAAIYFMGFRPLTALMQLAQLHTVGAAELGMHLKGAGIKTPATILLAKAQKDVMMEHLTHVEHDVLKHADDLGVTFEHSSQAALFRGVDDRSVRTTFGKRLLKVSDAGMWMFQQAETHNRRAGILAAYRVFAKNKEKFSQEAFDKAVEYNNNTNFMMNKGNIPYFMMHNPLGMTAYTLMSYTLNMTNWIMNRAHGSLSDTHIDPTTQRQAFLKLLGYTAVLGGVTGLPFADDLNKLIRKTFGRDLKEETQSWIRKHSNEDITNLISSGIFAPTLGINVTNNMNVRVPFLSGLLDDKSALESMSGASGALLTKGIDTATGLYQGQYRKAAEAASPEFLAGALRAERLHREGQRNAAGQPVYYEGQPIKLTTQEAILQGVAGIKSQRRSEIMETQDAEVKLQHYWQNQKKVAEKKAQEGDYSAVQEYNLKLLKDKNARLLVTPIKSSTLKPQKPSKGKTAYEISQ